MSDEACCNCPGPGFCERYQRQMPKWYHKICRGEVLTPEMCADYRALWSGELTPTVPAAIDAPPPKKPTPAPGTTLVPIPIASQRKSGRVPGTTNRFWHACTPACSYLGEISHKEPCSCGANRKIEIHNCQLLKTKHRNNPQSCVPLAADYDKLPKDLKPHVISCTSCPHRTGPRWISRRRLLQDTERLLTTLPAGITAVAGHARSGMLPATLLAMALHVPLWMIRSDARYRDVIETGHGWRLDRGGPVKPETLLIVDDNCMTGNSLMRLRPVVNAWAQTTGFDRTIEAVVYLNPLVQDRPELFAELVPWPCYYEWNFFNSTFSSGSAMDFDGILCRDCTQEELDSEEAYLNFLQTATPLYLPKREPVPLIVTGRQERHRKATLEWLARYGISCRQLIMHPDTPRTFDSIVDLKAQHFGHFRKTTPSNKRFGEPMFVESDKLQAQEIARRAGGTVICPAAEEVYRA